MNLYLCFDDVESALIGDVLEKFLGRPAQLDDHAKCHTDEHDPHNKILFYDRQKLGIIKYVVPTVENIEYGLKFIPMENWA